MQDAQDSEPPEASPPRWARRLLHPIELFIESAAHGGLLLVLATIAALVWANSPASASYHELWHTPFRLGFAEFSFQAPLIFWINELLMLVFFLLVGLEIKRELADGELADVSRATVPAIAALGGMVVPALLYVAIAHGPGEIRGFGVPMATDIAFSLAVLRALGRRAPHALVVLLTALAILDDVGAILVLALFYGNELHMSGVHATLGLVALLAALNVGGVRRASVYCIVGALLWVAMHHAGIHPTLAGVITALAVPVKRGADEDDASVRPSPQARLEHGLHPWVSWLVLPVFVLANAGIDVRGLDAGDIMQPVSVGVAVGLVFGKQLGVFGALALCRKLGLYRRADGVTAWHEWGVAVLTGIGFTMSMFMASVAFGDGTRFHDAAKAGILLGSLVAAVLGAAILRAAPLSASTRPSQTSAASSAPIPAA